ncbi:hypothetical protein PCLA_05r0511 [Pseudomonas citronellolis]|nr:hypothetical protein PCLA_05r0511 [Pseudomonas citronellolis]
MKRKRRRSAHYPGGQVRMRRLCRVNGGSPLIATAGATARAGPTAQMAWNRYLAGETGPGANQKGAPGRARCPPMGRFSPPG